MVTTVPTAPLAGLTDVILGRFILVHVVGLITVMLGTSAPSLSRRLPVLAPHGTLGMNGVEACILELGDSEPASFSSATSKLIS